MSMLQGTVGRRASQADHDSVSTNSDSGRGPSSEEGEQKTGQLDGSPDGRFINITKYVKYYLLKI